MKQFYLKPLLLTLLSLLGLPAFSHDFEVDGIYYKITSSTDHTVSVTYEGDRYTSYSDKYTGNVIIPQSVQYNGDTYSVTTIGFSAFQDCSGLTSVIIPNSVISIGPWAFDGCGGLTSVIIGNSVTEIGLAAFSNCSGLTSVTIPNSVTSIGDNAFSGCSGLTSVIIPDNVTSIGSEAFYECI